MGLTSLRDVLSGSNLNRPGVRRSINASMVVQAANRIIPGYLAGMLIHEVEAISFKDGVLRLRVKTAASRHGIKGIETQVLTKLRQDYPLLKIDRIQTFLSKEPSRYELP